MFGIAFSTSAQAALDVLHADGDFVRDTSGRAVILRGVTTITQDNNGQDMVMFSSEYQRIQSWGFNVQQIRVEGCRIGLIAPCQADTAYLNKLASWVDMAARRVFTQFSKRRCTRHSRVRRAAHFRRSDLGSNLAGWGNRSEYKHQRLESGVETISKQSECHWL